MTDASIMLGNDVPGVLVLVLVACACAY